ncbi:phage holin family protein [Candidatus Cardinium hertigii]|uniref:phage holin family protein n=1 Tax=Candidatus Cardinium hertigii TaxID=247481 RepID=UPI003D7DB74A
MFFKIVKIVSKLFGMACMVELVREKLALLIYTLQDSLKKKAKKVGWILLIFSTAFVLFGLGLRFLLLGLACWLNQIFASNYLGFFMVAFFCFLMVLAVLLMLRSHINDQSADQEKITDR